jgi:hypothetical protein
MQSQKSFLNEFLLTRFQDILDIIPGTIIIVAILTIWTDLDDPCYSTLIIPTNPRPI